MDLILKKIVQYIRTLNLSLKELEIKAKNRGIKDHKSLSIDKLLSILNKSEQVKKN